MEEQDHNAFLTHMASLGAHQTDASQLPLHSRDDDDEDEDGIN